MAYETEPSSLPQNYSGRSGLLDILRSSVASVREFFFSTDTPIQDGRETVHPEDTPTPENLLGQPNFIIAPQIPPAPKQHYQPDRRKDNTPPWKKRTETVAVGVALGLLIVNAISLCITNRSLKLTRSAFKATSAAVIVPDAGLQGDVLNVTFVNRGKGLAEDVSAHYKITREKLPEESSIWVSEWKTVEYKVVQIGEGQNNYTPIPEFRKEDWDLFNKQREAMRIEGTFQYSDGFDMIRQHFCVVSIGQIQTFPCSDLQARLRFNLPADQRWSK